MPVPPANNGSTSVPFLTYMPPVPCGPRSDLCPVKQRISTPFSLTLTGIDPADCDASTIRRRPCRLVKAQTSERSVTLPVTLEACVITTALVFFRRSVSRRSSRIRPLSSRGRNESETFFCFCARYNGRSTLLCSAIEVITWSPSRSVP